MMSLWDALRMNMMISYQELVRTFPNPSLAILGFRIYKANVHDRGVKKCTVICRSVLKSTDNIKYIKIDDETYLAKIV
ncbi:hypothetical protein AL478_017315 [Klebsiella pneumoniae]|nr:hypothetical protein AL478_017315 [Klebsiella pneumoniae]